MEEKPIAIAVLVVVAVVSAVSIALLYTNSSALAVYEQPASNKPAFLLTSTYIEDFDLCQQYLCKYDVAGYYGESEPAVIVGVEVITGNLVCGCPDGRTFQTRPDRIEVETY